MKTARILITGSRDWPDYQTVMRAIMLAVTDLHEAGAKEIVVVHGLCKTGADAMAEEFVNKIARSMVKQNGLILRTEKHEADWAKYGPKMAGPIRNRKMASLGADICLAFIMPKSNGTLGCVYEAEKKNIKIVPYYSGFSQETYEELYKTLWGYRRFFK